MSDPLLGPGRPVRHDLVTAARACLASGATLDQAAQVVLARTTSPIDAIKALRAAQPGLSLADAKPLVHRHLPAHLQRAAVQLWDDLEQAVRETIDQQ
jgi:hypothetical protein